MQWAVRRNQNGSNELLHYGVKGMKWGVRKEYEKTGRESNTGNKKDRWITTDLGVVKVDIFDKSAFDSDKNFISFIKKNLPERYAPTNEAQKALENLPRYAARLNQTTQQVAATNHNRYNNMRTNNCFLCSMAYEMRRRGYNVQAKEASHGGWGAEILHCFDVKDAFSIKMTPDKETASDKLELAKECYKQLEEQCLSYGDGARGCLGIQYYDYDSGHSMAWIVENGEFKIVDSQGLTKGSSNGYDIFLHAETVEKAVEVYRLDNAKILPGVTDFVEPFEATKEEKEAAKNKAPNMAEAKKIKEYNLKQEAKAKAKELEQKRAEQEKIANQNFVEKLIYKVSKVTNDLVSKGKETLAKLFNVQEGPTYINGKRVG